MFWSSNTATARRTSPGSGTIAVCSVLACANSDRGYRERVRLVCFEHSGCFSLLWRAAVPVSPCGYFECPRLLSQALRPLREGTSEGPTAGGGGLKLATVRSLRLGHVLRTNIVYEKRRDLERGSQHLATSRPQEFGRPRTIRKPLSRP